MLDRLGLGHQALRERYPKLVICALTGYGQDGPLAQRAGHDLNYLARAGVLGAQGPPDAPPQVPAVQLADVSGGLWCALAIVAALRKRDATGEGGVIDVAMTDGVLAFGALSLATGAAGQEVPRGDEVLTGGIAPYNTYLSKDGEPITLASLEPKFWVSFCAGAGIEADMAALLPGAHQAEWKAKLTELFAGRTRAEWEAFAESHDCCVEPVRKPHEIRADPHHQARGLWFDTQVGDATVPCFRTPVTPRETGTDAAPMPGEHTRVIFSDGGFSEAEIEALIEAGAIRSA